MLTAQRTVVSGRVASRCAPALPARPARASVVRRYRCVDSPALASPILCSRLCHLPNLLHSDRTLCIVRRNEPEDTIAEDMKGVAARQDKNSETGSKLSAE